MKNRRVLAGLAIATAIVLGHAPARALSITTTPLFVGSFDRVTGKRVLAGPDNGAGGGTLDTVMSAAADYWEGVIGDSLDLRVSYGWEKGLGTSILAETGTPVGGATVRQASIAFAAEAGNAWFLDLTPPTPTNAAGNSEYRAFSASQQDLGGGPINVGLDYGDPDPATSASGRFDLFTVALHELGHALGFGNLSGLVDIGSPFVEGLVVGNFLPDAGSVIPICCTSIGFSHLNIGDATMAPSIGTGERRLSSDADILAVAQVNHWTDVTLTGVAAIPEPAGAGTLILGAIVIHRMRRRAAVG